VLRLVSAVRLNLDDSPLPVEAARQFVGSEGMGDLRRGWIPCAAIRSGLEPICAWRRGGAEDFGPLHTLERGKAGRTTRTMVVG